MDKIILGKNIVLNEENDTRPNQNTLVLGGTGCGKTMSVVIPGLAHMENSSLIGIFTKKSVVSSAALYFEQLGYKTHVWNIATPKKDERIPDPLSYVKGEDDIEELAKQIVNANRAYSKATKYDPYFKEASEGLLTGLICYIFLTEESPAMKSVIDLFYQIKIKENGRGITTSIDNIMDQLQKKAPKSTAAKKLNAFLELPYTTAVCIRDDLEKAIQNVFPVSIQNAMSKEAFLDFADISINRTALFILTSPVRTAQYSFANILFGLGIRELTEFAEKQKDNHLPCDVRLIFDDFSCGFPIYNFEKYISVFRVSGISSLMLCQSLSQLYATYGEDNANTILNNCSSIVYLPGGMNEQTAAYIAKMLGVPVKDIMFMPVGNAVVFQAGKDPVVTKRYETLKDPLCQKLLSIEEKLEIA